MKCPTCNKDIDNTMGQCKQCHPASQGDLKPVEKKSPFANPYVVLGSWLGVSVFQFLNNSMGMAFILSMVTGIVVLLIYQSATKNK